MENNGSPVPIFETDDQNYVLVTLPVHQLFQASTQKGDQVGVAVKDRLIRSLEDVVVIVDQVIVEVSDQESVQEANVVSHEVGPYSLDILNDIRINPKSRRILLENIDLTNHTKNKEKVIDPLLKVGWIAYTVLENSRNRNQRYKLIDSGKRLLALIK